MNNGYNTGNGQGYNQGKNPGNQYGNPGSQYSYQGNPGGNQGYQQGYQQTPPPFFNPQEYYGRNNAFDSNAVGKSRGIAALLAIFLGCFGAQYFYLGKTTAAIICLAITLVSCFTLATILQVLTIIQGILMLTMTNADFDQKYVYTNSTFPLF